MQFDGWFHGLFDLHHGLSINNWQMIAEIADRVVVISESFAATSGSPGFHIKLLGRRVVSDNGKEGDMPEDIVVKNSKGLTAGEE